MRNYGQHNALLCGIREARGDVIITMDDDLQHPPEEISKLLQKWMEGYDVVYGYPTKLPHSFWRNLFSRLTKKTLAFVMGIKSVNEISAFRAFSTDLRKAFSSYQSPNVIIDVLLSWVLEISPALMSLKIQELLVNQITAQVGKSGIPDPDWLQHDSPQVSQLARVHCHDFREYRIPICPNFLFFHG